MVHNEPVSRYAGRRVEDTRRTPSRRSRARLLALALGVTVSLVAWGVLVYVAIDAGGRGRAGDGGGWVVVVLAGAGAVACLFVALLLGARTVDLLKEASPEVAAPPPRVPGGRRAAR